MARHAVDDIPVLPGIADYVTHYARLQPDAPALVGAGQRYSYAELAQAVDRAARALLAAGVRQGDRVAMLSTPHPDFWITFLATASIGAIWHGLNPRYGREELSYVVADSDPKLILARTRIDGRDYGDDLAALAAAGASEPRPLIALDGERHGMQGLGEFLLGAAEVGDEALAVARRGVGGRQACLLVYTSGSTGRPKGALLHHHGLIHTNRVRLSFARATPARIVTFLPINHVGCVGDTGCTLLLAGGCLVLMEKFEPEASLALMQSEKATIWGSVPTTFQLCLDLPNFGEYDLSALQLISWGGARMAPDLIVRLAQLCPNLATDYGMTETIGSVTYTDPGADLDTLAQTVGRPPPEFEVRIDAPKGETGEIRVRGDFIMLGYWNNPKATAEAIDAGGWLHTGDLAFEREDGAYVVVGRMSEMFKSGGYNVYPREIENVLGGYPGVIAAAVIGAPDPLFGEIGHAFVEVEPGASITVADLAGYCRAKLANYKAPKHFHLVAALPLLPIGKVDKMALRRRLNEN